MTLPNSSLLNMQELFHATPLKLKPLQCWVNKVNCSKQQKRMKEIKLCTDTAYVAFPSHLNSFQNFRLLISASFCCSHWSLCRFIFPVYRWIVNRSLLIQVANIRHVLAQLFLFLSTVYHTQEQIINVQNFLTAFQDLILINHKSPAQKNDVSEGCALADIGGQQRVTSAVR